jgi:hypothetical protein
VQQIFVEYGVEELDIGEMSLFWLVIADVQWHHGILEDDIKKKAIYYIDSGIALTAYDYTYSSWLENRKKVLEKLKEQLNSKQPEKHSVKDAKKYKCKWKIGDVYAYPLLSDYAKDKGLHGKYFLFYKVAECSWDNNYIIPVVWVKITNDSNLPKSVEEFNTLQYVQTSVEDEDRPFYHQHIEKQRSSNKAFEQKRDEFGELPIYRLALINTSKRIIPKKMIYLGNFQNVIPPELDNLPICDIEMPSFVWKFFEKNLIDCYFGLSLRQGSRYDKYRNNF